MSLSKAQIAILPNLGEVLYEPASKNREAKKCGNCALWGVAMIPHDPVFYVRLNGLGCQ